MSHAKCRFCEAKLNHTFCDLGMSPISNAYLKEEQLQNMEPFYPLKVQVCSSCFLVQLQEFETPSSIFNDEYAYFSSYSESWLAHAKNYTEMMINKFNIEESSQVIEIASNDGYLLQYFKEKNIPVLGIEPSANVATVAEKKGIETWVKFFGTETAQDLKNKGLTADLLLGNNVLAHVPDINDFVLGLSVALNPQGIITLEFPHILQLIENNQFDTIYHEHFSYFSFLSLQKIFNKYKLVIFDVDEISTHGGSLRIFARHQADISKLVTEAVQKLYEKEIANGLSDIRTYENFSERITKTKRKLLNFLIKEKDAGKKIVGYGAPAKGNTLLNYCAIRNDFIDFTVDRSPHKAGKYLPGTHIAILEPDAIAEKKPDYVLILPWNIKEEIMEQLSFIRKWDGKFIIPIPEVLVL